MVKDKPKYHQGDDTDRHRLLSFFQSTIKEPIIRMNRIRGNIYKIETKHQHYVGKGFSNSSSLIKQKWLTGELHKQGFTKTYQFLDTEPRKGINLNGKQYAVMNWIEHHQTPFMYNSIENCQKGMEVLKEYHDCTALLLSEGSQYFPRNNPYHKWKDRYLKFEANLPQIRRYISFSILKDLLEMGKESLNKLSNLTPEQKNNLVILHGDVAHHNFVRTKQEDLYLIDFDLASIGHPIHDYLQYCNRILPFLKWDFTQLNMFPTLLNYLEDPYFLYSLFYPTDIYREWNRAIQNNLLSKQKWLNTLFRITIDEYEQRQNFYDSVKRMVK